MHSLGSVETVYKQKNLEREIQDSELKHMLSLGEFGSNLVNLQEKFNMRPLSDFKDKQQVFSEKNCDLQSVQNCILQLTYFSRGLIQYEQKIEFLDVVFDELQLKKRGKPAFFRIGYRINRLFSRQFSQRDLILAIKKIFNCAAYFNNKNLNQDLRSFKIEFDRASLKTTIQEIIQIFQKSPLFITKSKILILSNFSLMNNFLKMNLNEQLEIFNLKQASQQQTTQQTVFQKMEIEAVKFFTAFDFEVNQKKQTSISLQYNFCKQKSQTHKETQVITPKNLKASIQFLHNPNQIRIVMYINRDHSDIFIYFSNLLALFEMNFHIIITFQNNQHFLAVTLSIKAQSDSELRCRIMAAFDALFVVWMVFESHPSIPYQNIMDQIIRETDHYLAFIKKLQTIINEIDWLSQTQRQ